MYTVKENEDIGFWNATFTTRYSTLEVNPGNDSFFTTPFKLVRVIKKMFKKEQEAFLEIVDGCTGTLGIIQNTDCKSNVIVPLRETVA